MLQCAHHLENSDDLQDTQDTQDTLHTSHFGNSMMEFWALNLRYHLSLPPLGITPHPRRAEDVASVVKRPSPSP